MALVKQYNNGKSTEFDLEQLNNVLEPGIYTIKTEAVSTLGNKSHESNGIEYRVIGPGVKIGNYTYRTTLVGLNEILKAGDNLVDFSIDTDETKNVYIERHGKYYFSDNAIKYLNENADIVFPGWHIPTKEELDNMFNSAGINLEEEPYINEIEDTLKELLNKVGFDTTDWKQNCFYDYTDYHPVERCYTTKDKLFTTVDYNLLFNEQLEWVDYNTSYYWPQLILCKNHD